MGTMTWRNIRQTRRAVLQVRACWRVLRGPGRPWDRLPPRRSSFLGRPAGPAWCTSQILTKEHLDPRLYELLGKKSSKSMDKLGQIRQLGFKTM